MDDQEVRKRQQSLSGTAKALHFTVLWHGHTADAGNDDVLMRVQPGTARIEYFHAASCKWRMAAATTLVFGFW